MSLYDWQNEAIKVAYYDKLVQSILCHKIQRLKIQNVVDNTFYVAGYIFDMPNPYAAFADINERKVYISKWLKNILVLKEYEFIVYHELAHIVHKHEYLNPRSEEIEADLWAANEQKTKKYGINTYEKLLRKNLDVFWSLKIEPEYEYSLILNERIKYLQMLSFSN